ncbi:MAG: RNA polymerase sigma factor [Ruminococcaceae bacterium]|nr:RNA polymerase sigma factor [Oscillospiraceae bacterium]
MAKQDPRITDDGLLDLFIERDERGIEEARERYGAMCQRIAANILGSEEDAEECVNDVLLRAWNAIPPECPAYFGAYLARLARHAALDRMRRRTARKRGGGEVPLCLDELADCAGDGDGWEAEKDARERLRDALNRFLAAEKPEVRAIFLRRYWYAYPIGEVARLSGKSEGAVKMILGRAKKRLKKQLEQEGFLK